MLFNSYVFILIFLPLVLTVYHLLGKLGNWRLSISWLILASLFFYGWWNPAYLLLIIGSILFNYIIGKFLGRKRSRVVLIFGVAFNILLIAYFKYANFFVDNINNLVSSNISIEQIILPLAISFFTFQQIAFLVDVYRGLTKEFNFLQYSLFVVFFPQLIAGPIVHHKDMLPQFANNKIFGIKKSHLTIGISIFILGLGKKVIFADNIALYSSPVFAAAENGVVLTFFEAWAGALAYTFQLYFDFSGYSDMAVGVARMFGIVLPINFYSPYKANSMIDFWRRWHITLSNFLRDYLYIPLGGNRNGYIHQCTNILITMFIGGLWHGAGWTFVIWGLMHGVYLVINHGWSNLANTYIFINNRLSVFRNILGRFVTFAAVVIAWVMFRSESLNGAFGMYRSMFGFNGISFEVMLNQSVFGNGLIGVSLLFILLLIIWFAPNTTDLMRSYKPALGYKQFYKNGNNMPVWKPSATWAFVLGLLTIICLFSMLENVSEFLYFQF